MSITTRSPFGELETLRDRMDRLFADLSIWSRPATETTGLLVDLRETDTDLVLETPLPGIKPEDIDIEVSHGVLTIKGEPRVPGTSRSAVMAASSGRLLSPLRSPRTRPRQRLPMAS